MESELSFRLGRALCFFWLQNMLSSEEDYIKTAICENHFRDFMCHLTS